MALIHPQSCECALATLDLFTLPPTQTSVLSGGWVEFHPVATLTDTGPIEFIVKGTEEYLDLSNSYIQVQARIVKPDGSALVAGDDDKHGPSNLWLHSLFSEVEVSVGGVQITSTSNLYAYRSYIESLLSYDAGAKETQLAAAMFYKDTANHVSATAGTNNKGLKERRNQTKRSKIVDMIGRLHADIFLQEKFLLNKVDVRVRLMRSRDAFSLMGDGTNTYRVEMVKASLFIRKATLNPAVMLAHGKGLEEATAKYPLQRVVMKAFAAPGGQLNIIEDNLFTSQIPKRLVVGLVDSTAYNGAFNASPYEFKHFDLNFLAVYNEGRQIPVKAFQPNFGQGQYTRSYMSLFNGLNTAWQDVGNGIAPEEFDKGYALYGFDLTPSIQDGSQAELIRSGSLRLEMGFGTALPNAVHVIVYAQFDGLLEIDKSRQCLVNFPA